ncbi:MAG: glycosyltransferase, partial [Actinomycetota bacterium]|nr:glycosyltransferase [Actinomycetota bacterium]
VSGREASGDRRGRTPVRIVWPHRWEHDKNPEEFFRAVTLLAAEGLSFEVAIAGQEFRETSGLLREAAGSLGDRLVHVGQPDTRVEYAELLAGSDIAVSTAHNEFFGLAMIEASYAGCFPLVPDRLAYPEIYPREFLYADEDDLVSRLREIILDPPQPARARAIAERFTFDRCAPSYRDLFAKVAHGRRDATA